MGLIDKFKGTPAEFVNPITDHAMDRAQGMVDEAGAKAQEAIAGQVDHLGDQLTQGLGAAATAGKDLLSEARRMAHDDLFALAEYQIVIRIGLEKKP